MFNFYISAKHMKKHLGDLMYACDMCDEKFRTQVEVRRHMLIHAPGMDTVEEIITEEAKESIESIDQNS